MFSGVEAVLFGHSHHPYREVRGGVLLLNPGSPTDRVDKSSSLLEKIPVSGGHAGGGLAWDGKYFWAPGGKGICKIDRKGRSWVVKGSRKIFEGWGGEPFEAESRGPYSFTGSDESRSGSAQPGPFASGFAGEGNNESKNGRTVWGNWRGP